jgi:hypothetical protein
VQKFVLQLKLHHWYIRVFSRILIWMLHLSKILWEMINNGGDLLCCVVNVNTDYSRKLVQVMLRFNIQRTNTRDSENYFSS